MALGCHRLFPPDQGLPFYFSLHMEFPHSLFLTHHPLEPRLEGQSRASARLLQFQACTTKLEEKRFWWT